MNSILYSETKVVTLKGFPYCPPERDELFDAELGVFTHDPHYFPRPEPEPRKWPLNPVWTTALAGLGAILAVAFTTWAVGVSAGALVDLIRGWL